MSCVLEFLKVVVGNTKLGCQLGPTRDLCGQHRDRPSSAKMNKLFHKPTQRSKNVTTVLFRGVASGRKNFTQAANNMLENYLHFNQIKHKMMHI